MTQKRNTRQKKILQQEIEKQKTFFTAEKLLEKTKIFDNKIGIATIYRHLKKLREEKKIYSYRCSGKTVYSNTKKAHCHFECTKTGKIHHFEIDNLDFLKDKIPGEISSFQLEIKGICNNLCECKNKK